MAPKVQSRPSYAFDTYMYIPESFEMHGEKPPPIFDHTIHIKKKPSVIFKAYLNNRSGYGSVGITFLVIVLQVFFSKL